MHNLRNGLAWAIMIVAQLLGGTALAQDVDINFEDLYSAGQKPPYTVNGVTFTWIDYMQGAAIYLKENDSFCLKINSPANKVVRIEFKGEIASSKYNDDMDVRGGNGKLTHLESGTFVWEGSSNSIQIWGASSTTNFYIKGLRLWFEGSEIITDEKAITATPDVFGSTRENFQLEFSCPDAGATYTYTALPLQAEDGEAFDRILVTFQATAPGKDPSEIVQKVIRFDEMQP